MANRGKDHVKAQRKARERDNGVCRICGSHDHPEGHHAFDFQFGGKADVDNNIVTLCRDCHKKVHSGLLDIFIW